MNKAKLKKSLIFFKLIKYYIFNLKKYKIIDLVIYYQLLKRDI